MTTFLILAAGQSTRFDGDKLRERFNGKTLPQYAAEFAMHNGADRVCVTLATKQVYTDGRRMRHTVLDDLLEVCDVEVALQPSERNGTGAAIEAWRNRITEETIVLFGDNLYLGSLPIIDKPDVLYFSVVNRPANCHQNLRLAVVLNGIVIEKPHQQTSGVFFAGFVKLPPASWHSFPQLHLSARKEFEIADLINTAPHKQMIDLCDTDMVWGDVTYAGDVASIEAMLG